jgi:protein-L-isoaspartate(D-aspartate) O-methyltransferase
MTQPTQNTTARFNMPHETARFNMIEQQIRTWDVLDPVVLQQLNDLPRERFVPASHQGLAFADVEIPIGHGQTMLSPKLEGRFLQELKLNKNQTVLHIGTGSGYFAGLLASLVKHVVTVEIDLALSEQAAKNLANSQIANVTLLVADGTYGCPNNNQYDVIVYTASSPVEPEGVRDQLNIGGALLIVLGEAPAMQATLIQRVSETGYRETVLFETCLPELSNAPQAEQFAF